jgi:hypothetical protein
MDGRYDSSQIYKKGSMYSSLTSDSSKSVLCSTYIYKEDDNGFDIVEKLWKKINSKRKLRNKKKNEDKDKKSEKKIRDTTIEFLKKSDEYFNTAEKNNIDNNIFFSKSSSFFNNINSVKSDETSNSKFNVNLFDGNYSNSKELLGGLTFNDVYDENISKSLIKITEIFGANKEDIEDLVSMQITFNRSWKLFLIGLFQYESINRFFSMMAINSSVKYINNTLLDKETLKGLIFTLNNISVSDESRVNRMMAIYLLGEISKYFGQIRSNEDLTLYTFKKISEQILYLLNKELQFYVNNKDDLYKILSEENEKKNYLINSLGKLTKYPSVFHDYIEKLSLFIIDEEMNINMKVLDEVNNILNDSKNNIKLETKKKDRISN